MAWYGWILVMTIAASSLLVIGRIGKARSPITPFDAAFIVACNGLMIWAIVALGGGC